MNIFRKSQEENKIEEPQVQPTTQEGTQPAPRHLDALTTEEMVRQWWQEHYNEAMPEEIIHWFKQLARTEARRLNTARQILTPQQKERIEEALRLEKTKLEDIEKSLRHIRESQEWIRRFDEKKRELAKHQERLYEVNKELAARIEDTQALERFETFETVQELFQRMSLLQFFSQQNKESLSQLNSEAGNIAKETIQKEKQLTLASAKQKQSLQNILSIHSQHEQANRILGAQDVLNLDEHATRRLLDVAEQQKLITDKECEELQAECDKQQDIISQQRSQRQTMEPHANLLEHGEMVLTQLDRLNELRQWIGAIQQQAEDIAQRGREENEMLSRVFAEYQKIDSEIKTLSSELVQHRNQNVGQSSYDLQNRAMELKSRRQMLLSAQSLWHRIQLGYQLMEEKTRALTTLRLNIDSLKHNIAQLEGQVEPMRKLCHEKEYTLTLSKSQNVIQLRRDLMEGVNCTVCGATHHPYHSDTLIEQNQLISHMQAEFDQLQADLTSKEKTLRELQLQLTTQTTKQEIEEKTLADLRTRQMEDVTEWDVFAHLDRSFQECSPSTNLEARATLLQQLIENAARDADEALHELDQYNFHQTRINEINEQLNQKEQALADLTVRLNEVNTGCQVLSRQNEQIRQIQNHLQGQYTQRYEQVRKLITLRDWFTTWQGNHDAIILRINTMMEKWQSINAEIQAAEQKLTTAKATLNEKQATSNFLRSLIHNISEEEKSRSTLRNEGNRQLDFMLGGRTVKEHFDLGFRQYEEANKEELEQREQMSQIQQRMSAVKAQEQLLKDVTTTLDAEATQCQAKLDVWLRQYNANNLPVQYSELEHTFSSGRDWNAIRTSLRELHSESRLEQANVEHLRSEIVALQAEGILSSTDEDTAQAMEDLTSQQKRLEYQHNQILMQLAQHEKTLQNDETNKAQLRVEEEERNNALSL